MEATCLQSAANTHQEVRGVVSLDVQLLQRVAEVASQVVTNLVIDMVLGTDYTDKDIDRKSPRKIHSTLLVLALSQ